MVDGGVCVPVINFIIRVYLQTVNESFLMSYFRLFAASYQLYNEYYSCYNDSCYGIIDNISFSAFNIRILIPVILHNLYFLRCEVNKLNAIFIVICHFN